MTFRDKDLSFTQTLLVTAGILGVIFIGVISSFHYLAKDDLKTELAGTLSNELSSRQTVIQDYLAKQRNRIQFIHATPPIQGIVRATRNGGIDPKDGTQLQQWKARLSTIFEGYLANNPDVEQLRYIGVANNGKELVRVERYGTSIKKIPEGHLQAKGGSGYFKEIIKYHPNKVYISDINLNKEFGVIQVPYLPTQRIAMPVFDSNLEIFGFVIANLNARNPITLFKNGVDSRLQMYLLDSHENFISHIDPEKSFKFEINEELNWYKQFKILPSDENTAIKVAYDNIGKINFYYLTKNIELSTSDFGRKFTVVLGYDEHQFQSILKDRTQNLIIILISLMVMVFVLFSYYQLGVYKRLSLLKNQAEFEAIVLGSHDGIISINASGIINSWNKSASDITGFPERLMEGQSIYDTFLKNADHNFIQQSLNSVEKFTDEDEFESKAITHKGKEIDIAINLSPIVLENGQTIGIAMMFRDITEKKRIELEMINLNTSLENKVKERTLELEKARNIALQSNQMKSDFIANISHEIRTPMNGVLGMIDLLSKGTLSDKQKHQIEMAKFSAQSLTRLINDILDLSKMEAGKLEIDNSEFNLIQLLCDAAKSLAIRMQEKNIEFILDISKVQHEHVTSDAMRINQIITNLVGNALKFTKKGKVALKASTTEDQDGRIIFNCSVIDTGKGIKKDKRDKLFDSFVQEDSSITKQYGGTGLGLSICRQLSHLLGGEISVSSQEGKGSEFTFRIPITIIEKEALYLKSIDTASNALLACQNIHLLDSLKAQLEVFNCTSKIVQTKDALIHLLNSDTDFDFVIVDESLAKNISSELETLDNLQEKNIHDKICILESTKHSIHKNHSFRSINKPVTPIECLGLLNNSPIKSDSTVHTPQFQEQTQKDNIIGKSILLVDDNDINLEVAKGVLEDFCVNILMANSASNAFEILKSKHIDAVFMDCQMPEIDGYTATKMIRNGEISDDIMDIPIIAMTAHAMSGAREICLSAGMNDYVPKPIDPACVKRALEKWLPSENNPIPIRQNNKK